MTVVHVTPDHEALTVTLVADLDAPPERAWQVWADPRQLERWWGPPTWPASFTRHEVRVGGTSEYVMTGPEGGTARGWWCITSVDAPRTLSFEDGFADEEGTPDDTLPVTAAHVVLEEGAGGGTRMTLTSRFATEEQMRQLAAMGMVEGLTQAAGQIDAVLRARGCA